MTISDFKNQKVLTEFGHWRGLLYDEQEMDDMLIAKGLGRLDISIRKELHAIFANYLMNDEVEYILEILNSLCKGSSKQQSLANVLTYTTLRLVKDKPYSEWYVDKLGFYCCESEKYEVNYIGLLLKKIVDYVIGISMNNGELAKLCSVYEFLTIYSLKNKLENKQDPLPDTISQASPLTIRKWTIALVLLHEMAHTFLDRIGKPHNLPLEEPMANLITLSTAEYFGDICFLEFVKWFIGRQDANYRFAGNLYEGAVNRGLSSDDILVCTDAWAREMVNNDKSLDVMGERRIVYDVNNPNRKSLADTIIAELVKVSDNSVMSEEDHELEIKIWHFLVRICNDYGFDLKNCNSNDLSGTFTVYTKNGEKHRNIKLITIISNYIKFLKSGLSFEDWKKSKKSWNSYNGQIYKHLPKSKAELDSILF